MKKLVILSLATIFMVSCGESENVVSEPEEALTNYDTVSSIPSENDLVIENHPVLNAFDESWTNGLEPETRECWQAEPGAFAGIGCTLNNSDTTFTEQLRISEIDGLLTYQATVGNQNDGATIFFPLSATTDSSLTFSNPQHDFPQEIEYVVSDNRLLIFVSGEDGNGEKRGFNLNLHKLANHVKGE